MTVLNILRVTPERVIAGSDSDVAVIQPDGPATKRALSKLYPIPHLPALIGGRGPADLIGAAALAVAHGNDLDATSLDMIDDKMRAAGIGNFKTEAADVVGAFWDARGRCFQVRGWHRAPGRRGFADIPMMTEFISPAVPVDGELAKLRRTSRPEDMAALVRAQVILIDQEFPEAGSGGKIIFAEMVPTGINVFQVGESESPLTGEQNHGDRSRS